MRHGWLWLGLLVGCGTEAVDVPVDPVTEAAPNAPAPTTSAGEAIVADVRADTDRDGEVRFDLAGDGESKLSWDAQRGAVFLANLDDDTERCPDDADDLELPKCHDADNEVVDGDDDALDLAPLATRPWAEAPDDAQATITIEDGADYVRLFRKQGGSFSKVATGDTFDAAAVREGLSLALEGKDIVRDRSKWDGYAVVRWTVTTSAGTATDAVKLRVAPIVTYHHLLSATETFVSYTGDSGNAAMRADLALAAKSAGVAAPRALSTQDPWAQDFFETGYMSMPGKSGAERVIQVAMRSANLYNPKSRTYPLRRAGRFVFTQFRGKDRAGIQQFDATRGTRSDTLNSFGNLETIPPYTFGGAAFPLGRALRGSIPTFAPDPSFSRMLEGQSVQPPVYVDTSWLLVGHVDETISFVKAPTPRGWALLLNDARLAKQILEDLVAKGRGGAKMFVGKSWDTGSAEVTVAEVLADTDVMASSAEAAVEVDAQLAVLKKETGITDAEIVRVPFLHWQMGGGSVAYQPGTVNGLYLADGHFVAPKPHGPSIDGKDPFEVALETRLADLGITVHFAEDWDTYHAALGEVHCGTNAIRQTSAAKWWTSGR